MTGTPVATTGGQALEERVAAAMGPLGPLRRVLVDYEVRPQQLRAALAVARALERSRTVLIEAPTGSGKSLGALVPLAIHLLDKREGKAVYSTASITLQEQLVRKDIPAVQAAFGSPTAAVQKGMARYACLLKWLMLRDSALPLLAPPVPGAELARVEAWIRSTSTGDQAELETPPSWWGEIAADHSDCLGPACSLSHGCFALTVRERARAARLVVMNHHLLLSYLRYRLPSVPLESAIVFDEAHRLPEIATAIFGTSFSGDRLLSIIQRVHGLVPDGDDPIHEDARRAVSAYHDLVATVRLGKDAEGQLVGTDTRRAASRLLAVLNNLAARIQGTRWSVFPDSSGTSQNERAAICLRMLASFIEQLQPVADPQAGTVSWVEPTGTRDPRPRFCTAPVELAPLVGWLFDGTGPRVLMSATLSTSGDFAHLRKRLGIADADEIVLPPVFDYAHRMRYYFPDPPIDPNADDYIDRVARELTGLLRATRGRALVLFTSYADMRAVAAHLTRELPYTIITQDEASGMATVEAFRNDVHSILLATMRMWEGVDVPGESLSVLAVARLPFDVPTEPLVQARCEAARAAGENPFFTVLLPDAITRMRQGVGRLLRSSSDKGVVAILDGRVLTKPYGKRFLGALPQAPRVATHEEAARFIDSDRR